MTGKEPHKDHDRLARLYREQGDIEPGPGVDQRIRARAKADTRLSGLPRPAHWLGGVAVAASLFVVVSIVTNIQPPEAELPATQSTPTNAEESAPDAEAPEAGSAESDDFAPRTLGDVAQRAARQAPERQGELEEVAERAKPEALAEQAEPQAREERSGPDSSALASDSMLQRRTRWSAADNAAETAREQYRAVGELGASAEGDGRMRAPLEPTVGSDFDLAEEGAADAERSLWLIGQLISIGNVERARARLEDFRERYPEQEIPQDLLDRLERLETDARDD
ncbi:hypothetical protein [Wenzhouxiangella sp. EGI_FJ10409]|uniref:hypothetical protein n=1 Tax=Wenzhouxiangella sp. EGI_FJ10409 TaxID=3243767 RepID=UPI0035D83A25